MPISDNDIAALPSMIKERIAANPYAVVGGAFGLGFVLGGGLFTRLTARVVKMVFRASLLAALPIIQDGLLGAAGQSDRRRPDESSEAVDAAAAH